MAGINKILTVIAGVACLLLSSESIAGKPGDGGTSSPQDVNVVNTPMVLSVQAPKSISTVWVVPAQTTGVYRLDYTPPAGMRVVIKSLLIRSNAYSQSEIHYAGGYQALGATGEVTIALPEGAFTLIAQFNSPSAYERSVPVLLTFYEVPAN